MRPARRRLPEYRTLLVSGKVYVKPFGAVFVALAFVVTTANIAAAEADTPEARARLVDEYFTYVPMRKLMDEMVREVSKQIPERKRR